MRRWVYVCEQIVGQPEKLEEVLLAGLDQGLWLRGRDLGDVAADGSYVVELTAEVVGVTGRKAVRIRTGAAQRAGGRVVIPIVWQAEPAALVFPSFDGSLELEPLSSTSAQLWLVGSYDLPLGAVGFVTDATGIVSSSQRASGGLERERRQLLREVAPRTASALVGAIARALSAQLVEPPAVARPARSSPLQVCDVMSADPIVLDPELPLKTAALLLFHADISGAPVVADDGTLIGVLSERDLLVKEATRLGWGRRGAAEHERSVARTVAEACSRPAFVTVAEARVAAAAREMLDHDVSRLVVLEGGRVAGIISRHDVLAALVRDDQQLQIAVRAVLDGQDGHDVHAMVMWGEVALTGHTELRSSCQAIVASVRGVDGVMDIDDSALSWRCDDVLRTLPMPM